MKSTPSYIKLYEEGKLKERVEKAYSMLESCNVCPHSCKVNRLKGEKGFCKTAENVKVASFFPHRGEEFPIRGYYGSGTIFISYCNMRCVYCQNYDISHLGEGKEYTPEEIAGIMLYLQEEGCHNINWVTPSHVVPQLLKALYIAVKKGLKIPIVYNTSSYDNPETVELLYGIVDIYLPDIKYLNGDFARKYSKVKNYPEVAKQVIKMMFNQVGNLKTDERGIAYRGVLVRHLVLPNGISTTKEVLDFLYTVSPHIYVNIMAQYHPYYKACDYPELCRRITDEEYRQAVEYARTLGLNLVID
ncbi:putative pyruvate formate lyase activating enzyme [Persephonella hydrogeniphila]|uniref:Putative pyruvate formate lyase activating enzyme n=1 Tax=Persephonella hydrogeniphila TaxID=198703 RepID=A0A285NGP8_9AQUI|nr:radical SAM protein [Persephonella hydrogeniphila]SNZ08674.1 putative pyruvate formate lyase activating enzyme [Persephonella hydrogeniphila]